MLVLSDLNKKPVPEAYMAYALYDRDSNMYDSEKILLSKKARNKHEELKKDIFVEKDGYIEAFVVNETSENVWPVYRQVDTITSLSKVLDPL